MTEQTPISQLPNGQAISPVSALATITLDGCVIGSTTPKAGTFTTVSASTPITPSSGGTGNAFIKFTGPSVERTYTVPDASTTLLTTNSAITIPQGGTAITSVAAYGVLCGGTTSTGALQTVSGTGTSGQVLTSNGAAALPTWQPAGSGAMTLLQTQTASSSATIDFTSNITSAYKTYLCIFQRVKPATDAVSLYLLTGNGSFASTGYAWANEQTAGGSSTPDGNTSDTQLRLNAGAVIGNAAAEHISGYVYINDPSNTDGYPMFNWDLGLLNASSAYFRVYGGGTYNTSGAVDRIRFLFSSGNIASGTFKLYGIS